jgi:hypothetical protein
MVAIQVAAFQGEHRQMGHVAMVLDNSWTFRYILFSSFCQERIMKRDRLNRIFYQYVIKDENLKKEYLKLDSLM